MAEHIAGSPTDTHLPYLMYVNNSGAVPIAGYYNDVVYPLQVDVGGGIIASTSGTGLDDFTLRYSQVLDYGTGTQPIYMGLANPGTATSSAGWQIRKNTFSGTSPPMITQILFASGNNNFDKICDNRVSSPYS